jgi:tRNA threonylcarbamoyladenosine biosynthesis protein TsaE
MTEHRTRAATVARISTSPEQTRRFGALLAAELPDGAVVALVGELGAGKTALVQGAAGGLGALEEHEDGDGGATSPTFVLVREYGGGARRRIVHVDAHRLRSPEELVDLGSDDFLGKSGISFVEWAGRVRSALPRPLLTIGLSHVGPFERRIELAADGPGGDDLLGLAVGALERSGCGVENR